jgi:DNA polymerase-3 subunit epsilon
MIPKAGTGFRTGSCASNHGGMREIVIDTETTGLDPYQGHRLVEVGCVEIVNGIPSGHSFHRYVNPERDMPVEAFNVHGLSAEFLRDKPLFAEIIDDFLEFIGDAPLVAHNAMFDLGFINAELDRATRPTLGRDRLVDTLLLARRKHPGGPNRLDDLCSRYGIDNSRRTKHGALLDAEILAEVYLELIGARQAQLVLVDSGSATASGAVGYSTIRVRPVPLPSLVSAEERAAHRDFIATLGDNAIWRQYLPTEPEETLTVEQLPAGTVAEITAAAVAEVLGP